MLAETKSTLEMASGTVCTFRVRFQITLQLPQKFVARLNDSFFETDEERQNFNLSERFTSP